MLTSDWLGMTTKPIYGVGINNAPYVVQPVVNGKRNVCPFYRCWFSMFVRCYSEKEVARNPTYDGCSVDPRWHHFMDFREWMVSQDWEGNQLDKDLLISGNKVYSPETCIFVSHQVNTFMTDRVNHRSVYGIGVRIEKKTGKFVAQCNSLGKGQDYLGLYDNPETASLVYWRYKCGQATKLAEIQTDTRVAEALLKRYRVNNYND